MKQTALVFLTRVIIFVTAMVGVASALHADVIVPDGESTLKLYSDTGSYLGDLVRDPIHLNGASAVLVEGDQNYMDVVSKTDGKVLRYSTGGTYLGVIASGLDNPTTIQRAGGNQIAIVNSGGNNIPIYTTSGTFLGNFLTGVSGMSDILYPKSRSSDYVSTSGNIIQYSTYTGGSAPNYYAYGVNPSGTGADGGYLTYDAGDWMTRSIYATAGNTIKSINLSGYTSSTFATLIGGDTAVGVLFGGTHLYVSGLDNNYIYNSNGSLVTTFGGAQGASGATEMGYIGWNVTPKYLVEAVPEPSSFALLAIGGLLLGGYAWRKKEQTV